MYSAPFCQLIKHLSLVDFVANYWKPLPCISVWASNSLQKSWHCEHLDLYTGVSMLVGVGVSMLLCRNSLPQKKNKKIQLSHSRLIVKMAINVIRTVDNLFTEEPAFTNSSRFVNISIWIFQTFLMWIVSPMPPLQTAFSAAYQTSTILANHMNLNSRV